MVDESFVDFSENFERNSLLHNQILTSYPNLVVVKSISKSYGVPGLRLGILASADEQLIAYIKKNIAIWNINSFGEYYMQIFNKYQNDYRKACYQFIAERDRFGKLLAEIPYLRVLPSQANYFCCEITSKFTSHELSLILLDRFNIMIKDCDSKTALKGRNFIRVSVRDTQDNNTLIEALKELDKQKAIQ